MVDAGELGGGQAVLGEIEQVEREAALFGGIGNGDGEVVRVERLCQPRRQQQFAAVLEAECEAAEQGATFSNM